MIHSITANHDSFNPVEFTPGLNVILADRTDTSTQKDTRNGLGKSTLIEIIHFCLGSNVRRGEGLLIKPLQNWKFTLEITLSGTRVKVTRAIANPNVFIIEGKVIDNYGQPDETNIFGERVINLVQWRTLLGQLLFGISTLNDGSKGYKPSFRSLLSYFVRRGNDAFINPFRHSRMQQPWDVQLHIGFLIGLNWEYAARWQQLKDRQKGLKAFNQAVKAGITGYAQSSVGELEAERIQLESQFEEDERALQNFKVHPQYESIQNVVDQMTTKIHTLTNENIVDRRLLKHYREAITEEKPPSDMTIDKLYEDAGVVFSGVTRSTLAEAREFHSRIIKNRQAFLQMEISRLVQQIEVRNMEIRKWTEDRAASLEILRTHGALQEMTKLQERHLVMQEKLNVVRTRISEIKDLTMRKHELQFEKTELAQASELDHEQRRKIWSIPVRIFNNNSQVLYKTPGRLVIDIGNAGFEFEVEINRSGSEGINKMKIFCFDLMLLDLMYHQKKPIDFLIHDSTLFDGVDSRQRALAIELACEVSKSNKLQYICMLNSDMVPEKDFSNGFDFNKYVRLLLTDQKPSKSLLGFQYNT